jgi:hypothetical protein
MPHRRIRVKGVRKEEIDTDRLALAYWLMAKRAVEQKRQREAEERKARRAAGTERVEDRTHARG